MAVFRVERNTGYTVMSNHHLRNKELSLKAKGLLSQMLSLPEDWDYTLSGLSYINRESIDAIRTAVWELEKAGYITRRQGRDEKGKMTAIEYTIYEQPQPPELDCPVLENPTADNPILENPTTDNPTSENPTQVIRLSPTGKGMDGKPQYVNPMDINLNYSEDDNPLALKSDFILSLCELVIGGKEGLQPVEKTVIDRSVRNVYRPFLADPDPAKMPILGDLYNELLKQPEPEAARIAAALELYVSGSLNVFNHRTNVELSNRLVCFDIKQLGKQLKKLGMLIVQDQVWNRVTVNRAEKKATRYYMDEFHLLLKEEQTAAYSVEIWKRFRKWGGIPTAITQNVKDLLSSREVENIFENSDFVLMLNQAQGDRAILAKQLNISPQQMKYVTHTEAGEGLIFYGNVVLPFIDRFPTDTELYRLLTTKPEEVSKA